MHLQFKLNSFSPSLNDAVSSPNVPIAVPAGVQFAVPDMGSVPEVVIPFGEGFGPPASCLESASLFSDNDGPVHAGMASNSTPDNPTDP